MIKGLLIIEPKEELLDVILDDFSQFEEKMTKIKNIKEVIKNIDKSDIEASIAELNFSKKRVTAKKIKKVFNKVLIKMIEEIE